MDGKPKQLGGVTGAGFRPGQSGNPGGRPKGASIAGTLREFLDGTALGSAHIPDGRTVRDLVVESIVRAACTGDVRAQKLIADLDSPKGHDKTPDARDALLTRAEEIIERKRSEPPEA